MFVLLVPGWWPDNGTTVSSLQPDFAAILPPKRWPSAAFDQLSRGFAARWFADCSGPLQWLEVEKERVLVWVRQLQESTPV